MTSWKKINDGSWLFTEGFITGYGGGVGPFHTSYIINETEQKFLNGKISAKIKIKDWKNTGSGLICRANEFGSFVSFYFSPDESLKDSVVLRLSVFVDYLFIPIISLKKEVILDDGYNYFELSFISGEIIGSLKTSKAAYTMKYCIPHIPIHGYVGIVKFYKAGITVRDFKVEKFKFEKTNNLVSMKKYKFDVFISHSSKDKELILQVIADLQNNGISYWVDHEQIQFGDNITNKIEDGLQGSKYILVALSKNLGKSNWCRAEYGPILNREYNMNSEKKVIPINLDNCSDEEIPLLLYDKRRADFTNKEEYTRFINFLKI